MRGKLSRRVYLDEGVFGLQLPVVVFLLEGEVQELYE